MFREGGSGEVVRLNCPNVASILARQNGLRKGSGISFSIPFLSLYLPSPSLFLNLLPPVRRLLDRCTSVYVSARISVSLCFFLSFSFSSSLRAILPLPPSILRVVLRRKRKTRKQTGRVTSDYGEGS